MEIKTLVVDNNPVLLKAISSILIKEGCIVEIAGNGLEALELLQDYSPDIVFTDLIMPQVSGEQLCRIMRNSQKHDSVFIVVLSAIILEDRRRILKEINYDVCIAKGNIIEIGKHIREALELFKEKKASSSFIRAKDAKIPAGLQASEVTGELLSDKNHLLTILANLNEGIIELNAHGKIITANSAALNVLACREENVIGVVLSDVIDWMEFKKDIVHWTEKQLVEKGMQHFEITENNPLVFADKVVIASFIPVHETGAVFGLCIFHNITRQFHAEKYNRQVDDALKLVKKMDAMSCMAGGVAHDFNNLLTVICGNLDIIALQNVKNDCGDHEKRIDQARNAALAAVDLTRRISCFSNFGIINRQRAGIDSLVRTAVKNHFEHNQSEYKITLRGDDCDVYVDIDEIAKAISNVLQNAQESSSESTIRLTIEVDVFSSPQLMSGQYVPAGEYVRIDIIDTGKGIKPEQLLVIFDPYYSTKERGSLKGMGLGLTIVYASLRNHGGYVVVRSSRSIGTTVSLYLPVLKNEGVLDDREQDSARGKPTILLIEPDKQMADIGDIMLTYLGFIIVSAGNRDEAIRALKEIRANPSSARPLVILDISELNGESAVETRRLLHEIDPALQIIAMSGTVLDPIMENCKEYGFVNALPKPYSMDSLKHITNTVLHR